MLAALFNKKTFNLQLYNNNNKAYLYNINTQRCLYSLVRLWDWVIYNLWNFFSFCKSCGFGYFYQHIQIMRYWNWNMAVTFRDAYEIIWSILTNRARRLRIANKSCMLIWNKYKILNSHDIFRYCGNEKYYSKRYMGTSHIIIHSKVILL